MNLYQYLEKINTRYKSGITTEHSFRADLQNLLEDWLPDMLVTNEPTRITCGAPDYILTRHDIPVGYIEAKDLGVDLNSKTYTEQFTRYRKALPNLIITNYLDFQFYKDGELVTTVSVGRINGNRVDATDVHQDAFIVLLRDFATQVGQTIRSSLKLATMMANKAKLLASVIGEALQSDEDNEANSTLKEQLRAFQDILIHEITAKEFADIYAQTIAYGMFAARLNDPSLPTFTRMEAAELIPKSNPFLRKLFQYIAGYDLDVRIVWIVDALADIFRATDVAALLKNFGNATQQRDPIIHFYETFLSAYDPKLRKARGVWYTPEPVVSFIVRAVDDILKTEFRLKDGLADTSKTKIKTKIVKKATADKRSKIKESEIEQEVHRVQILDPATGTGTFLAEVVKFIYNKKFEGQQGIWSSYVDNHLVPRLNGFELLMASYAMAHLKLELLLAETGYKPTKDQRLKVYLTNSLEEHHPDTGTLFASWLSDEANQANRIKRETPVMVILGNPPYNGESINKGEWIMNLMEDYKKEPGGVQKLNERNPKWINDDYVKFIRFSQYFIEKNGEGVLAFINPHGYLDNPTFRGMRWHLLKTYDKIYTVDLHGNSNKKEVSPDGSPDENVFDILQGVSINIFVKNGQLKQGELGKVFHFDLFGKREPKYNFLSVNNIQSVPFNVLDVTAPNYFFVKKDYGLQKHYEEGFSISELFKVNSVGIVTARDGLTIHMKKDGVRGTIDDFLKLGDESARTKYNLGKDAQDWTIASAKKDLITSGPNNDNVVEVQYRPFDVRWTYYTGRSKGFHCRPRVEVMNHFFKKENLGLCLCRQLISNDYSHVSLTDKIVDDSYVSNKTRERGYVFPLYIYPEAQKQTSIEIAQERLPNLNDQIVEKISDSLGLSFDPNKSQRVYSYPEPGVDYVEHDFGPEDLFDYIYAILHSTSYRTKYRDFLKSDFPRIPYPTDATQFWKLMDLGAQLRLAHLLKSDVTERYITKYPEDGSNTVEAIKFDGQKVWINAGQYFDCVPSSAWEFLIGGYQPAQKWLKDRKGRVLTFEEILHYQKIIAALVETERIMTEIDLLEIS